MSILLDYYRIFMAAFKLDKQRVGCISLAIFVGAALLVSTLLNLQINSKIKLVGDDNISSLASAFYLSPKSVVLFDTQLSTTEVAISETGWDYQCAPNEVVIEGRPMLDNSGNIINPQAITWTNPISAEQILFGQVSGRFSNNNGQPIPENVTFSHSDSNLTVNQPITNDLYAYSFITRFQSISPLTHISASVNGNAESIQTARGLIIYRLQEPLEADSLWSSVGRITNQYVYTGLADHDRITETLTFSNPIPVDTTIQVTAVIVDYNNDGRPATLAVTAGGVSKTITNADFGTEQFLNIVEIELPSSIITTNQVQISLHSPENGDSLVLAGINASYRCASENDYYVFLPAFFKPLTLTVNVTSTPAKGIAVGLPLTYSIMVSNGSYNIQTAEGLELVYELPPELIINPHRVADMNANSQCDLVTTSSRIIKCDIGALHPGDLPFKYDVHVIPIQSGNINNRLIVHSTTPNAGGNGEQLTNIARCIPNFTPDNHFTETIEILDMRIPYCGKLADNDDYYSFTLTRTGTLSATLIKYINTSARPMMQLVLYSKPTKNNGSLVVRDYGFSLENLEISAPIVITKPHTFYLRVYHSDPYPLGITYTLHVQFIPNP